MDFSIQLDCQLFFRAKEIEDSSPHTMLPAKLPARQLSSPQKSPKVSFSWRKILPELSSARPLPFPVSPNPVSLVRHACSKKTRQVGSKGRWMGWERLWIGEGTTLPMGNPSTGWRRSPSPCKQGEELIFVLGLVSPAFAQGFGGQGLPCKQREELKIGCSVSGCSVLVMSPSARPVIGFYILDFISSEANLLYTKSAPQAHPLLRLPSIACEEGGPAPAEHVAP